MSASITKTALITGASSGLGAEFANQLALKGYNLILVARREERLKQLGNSLQNNHGISTTIVPADLSVPSNVYDLVSLITNTPNIRLLINNAGFGTSGRFYRVDPEKIQAMLQVHMVVPVMLCRAVLPGMIGQNGGAIVNVASLAGVLPIRSVMYGSTKAFLVKYSEALHDELRHQPIIVQALCPGFFYAEFHDTPEYSKFSRATIPKFLWMTPQQIVKVSLESLDKNKTICIPGTLYGFVGVLARNSFTAGLIKTIAQWVLSRKKIVEQKP